MSAPAAAAEGEFASALAAIEGVDGWLSVAQARTLWEHVRALQPPATIVEIGSFRGRSTIMLARASAPGVALVAIDPHAGNDRGPQQIRGSRDEGQREHEAFRANLERAGVSELVRHVRRPSQQALDAVDGPIDLLFIDGAHRYAPARDDIAGWGARLRPGGTLLLHDSFSAVGVTLAQARLLLLTSGFRFTGRQGTMSEYRREQLSPGDRALNAIRQLAQLPSFARNILVKLALLARMRRLAWLLGQRTGEWPY